MPSLSVAINALKAKHGAKQFDDATNKIKRGAKDVDSSVKKTDKSLNTLGSTAKKVAVGLIGVAAAYKALRFAMASVKEFAAFEMGLANVSTMLDDTTMKYMPAYEKQVKKMAREFGQSTGTLQKGLYDILSASIGAEKAIKVLRVSAKAAIAGLTDTGTAADALTTILNSYGLEAEEATKIGNILFATVKAGKITFGELAGSIGKVASLAAAVGLDFTQVSAAISTMTRAGVQSDIAMTALKAILTAFLKPQGDAIIVAKKFNLVLNAATLETIGLTGVMEKLKNATNEEVAAIFPNVRALTGVAALRGNLTGLIKDQEKALYSLGMQEKAYQKIAEQTGQKLKRLSEDWKAVKVSLGEFIALTVYSVPEATSALNELAEARERWGKIGEQRGAERIELPDIESLRQQSKETIKEIIADLEEIGQHVPGPLRQMLEKTYEDVVKMGQATKELNAFNEGMRNLVGPSIDINKLLDEKVAIREKEIETEKTISGLREKYFAELEFEKTLIGLTTDARERAIKGAIFEAEAKKLLGESSKELVDEYKNELKELQDLYIEAEKAQQYYIKIEEGIEGMIRSPLTALLDESRGIQEVLKDELKNLATSVLQMMYEDVITKPLMESIKAGVQPALAEVGNMIKDFLGGLVGGITGRIGNILGMGVSAALGGGIGGGGTPGTTFANPMAVFGAPGAKGLISDMTFIKQCARGDLLNGPTLFPMSNGGVALGGEAGKEAIMPLGRDSSGRLGVRAESNGGEKQTIKIINVMDESQYKEYLNTGDGERQVVNIMRRNAAEIQEIAG